MNIVEDKKEKAKRLFKIIANVGLSVAEISRMTRINKNTLYSWRSGHRVPKSDILKQHFNVNPTWYNFGEGDMYLSNTKDESQALTSNAEPLPDGHHQNTDNIEVEFITAPANAGVGYTFEDVPITVVKDIKATYKKSYKQVKVVGDSMLPTIPNGWRITFDTALAPNHNDIVVATANGVLVVKRFKIINGAKHLVSDNSKFDHCTFNGGDNVIIHGVVIEMSKY